MTCNKSKICYVHEGRQNLRKLRTLIQKIKPNHPGWKIGLKWNLLIGGFLETLLNFRHIREELIQTKREVDKFNKSRMELPKYIEEINHLLRIKPEIKYPDKIEKQKPGISKRIPAKKKTIARMRRKLWENEHKKRSLHK